MPTQRSEDLLSRIFAALLAAMLEGIAIFVLLVGVFAAVYATGKPDGGSFSRSVRVSPLAPFGYLTAVVILVVSIVALKRRNWPLAIMQPIIVLVLLAIAFHRR